MENRVVRLVTVDDGDRLQVRGAVEDRFHHFRVWADCDLATGTVAAAGVDAVRFPYTGCPAAGERLALLAGAPLAPRASAYFRDLDPRQQCTHQLDTLALALALGARGVRQRRYDMRVELDGDATHGQLWQDGKPLLEMTLDGTTILSPPRFAGRDLGSGFTGFVATLDPEEADAALALRRMVFVAQASAMNPQLDEMAHAPITGGCWVQQPENALRVARLNNAHPLGTGLDALAIDDDAFLMNGVSAGSR
ncbi:hypothetical protein ACFOMD_10225 [Sphingoaurantiacus capsulatus]|uniref:DUF2889 domain-containing protein n=1 Tax=Sphingoaurantiacus capsulatus TaxID=1771310 RepID=A0ABV7XE70_9SPHN